MLYTLYNMSCIMLTIEPYCKVLLIFFFKEIELFIQQKSFKKVTVNTYIMFI